MKRTSILVAAIGAAAVLGAGGTALAATTDDNPAATPRATGDDHGLRGDGTADDRGLRGDGTVDDSPAGGAGLGGAVSATDAEGLALAATGGGRVVRVEAETEHGTAVWSVRIVVNGVRYDIDVDRSTGEVLPHGHGADDGVTGDRHGRRNGSDDNATRVKTASDDKGGQRVSASRHAEPGDDKGGRRASASHQAEPGDDKGGRHAEPGDDKGGRRVEAGDDKGGRGGEAGDDHGRHGGDDR
jgi:uncharacterized membrane protein YkoI